MRNEKKNAEQLIGCTCKISHISAAIYPRNHTHLLSKLFPNKGPEISSILVLFDKQII